MNGSRQVPPSSTHCAFVLHMTPHSSKARHGWEEPMQAQTSVQKGIFLLLRGSEKNIRTLKSKHIFFFFKAKGRTLVFCHLLTSPHEEVKRHQDKSPALSLGHGSLARWDLEASRQSLLVRYLRAPAIIYFSLQQCALSANPCFVSHHLWAMFAELRLPMNKFTWSLL